MNDKRPAETSGNAKGPLRSYEPPRLTVLGTAATLTRNQPSRPTSEGGSDLNVGTQILFFGDNA
jgi:hypothetical protein